MKNAEGRASNAWNIEERYNMHIIGVTESLKR